RRGLVHAMHNLSAELLQPVHLAADRPRSRRNRPRSPPIASPGASVDRLSPWGRDPDLARADLDVACAIEDLDLVAIRRRTESLRREATLAAHRVVAFRV